MEMENGGDARDVMVSAESPAVKAAAREVRMGFIRKVYGVLMAQLLVTFLVAAPFQDVSPEWLNAHSPLVYGAMILSLVLICVMTCFQKQMRIFPTNYILLFSFTACEGVLVGFISASYTVSSVIGCVGITMLIFGGLTVYAWTTKSDFTGMGPYLYGALISVMIFGMCMGLARYAFGWQIAGLEMGYDIACILIFVFYIIYDTQLIVGGDHKHQFCIDDYVFAALSLYLDIINLFLHLLRLFGERRR